MKYLFAILLLVGFAPKAQAALGNDHPLIKMCEIVPQYEKTFSSIPTLYPWPTLQVIPYAPFIMPGVLAGAETRTSVLTLVCTMLSQIEKFESQSAIENAKDITNTVTEGRFNEHLDMADSFWNLANNLYDFESGAMRPGAIESAATHRDINEFMGKSYAYYNKNFNSKEAKLQTRGEKEAEMNEFAALVKDRALLKDATSCPVPKDGINYEKVYKNEIRPAEMALEEATDDMNFFKNKLLEMGPRFMNTQANYLEYAEGVEKMVIQGVDYQVTYKNKDKETTKPSATRKGKDGMPMQEKKIIKVKTQVFTARSFAEVFEKFRVKYSEDWSSWVTAQFLSRGSQGLLTDPQGKVEAEFKDLSYECNPTRLMKGIDIARPDYQKVTDERVEKCQEDTKINQKKAENLFNYYVTQLSQTVLKVKQANATIWTKESWYLGRMRAVNTKDATEGFQQEQVTCTEGNELSPGQMDQLKLKNKAVTLRLKEMIAKQQMKKTALIEERSKAQSAVGKELADRQKFASESKKSEQTGLSKQSAPTSLKGGM